MDIKAINKYLKTLENSLLKTIKIDIELNRQWSSKFPDEPGVYIFFEKDKIVYVGETSSIKKRMINILDTRHHTIRRKIGKFNFSTNPKYSKAASKPKFLPELEKTINNWMTSKMKLSFLPIYLGRKELEAYITKEHKPKYNSPSKRGRK